MKIGPAAGQQIPSSPSPYVQRKAAEALAAQSAVSKDTGKAADVTASGPRSDEVALSEEAERLSGYRDALEGVPDMRQERVAELRRAVQEGTYEVPTDELAARLARVLRDAEDQQ